MTNRLVVSAVVLLIAASGVIALGEARAQAHERCEASTPPFPTRVLAIDVDWTLSDFGYDCVYRLYHGGRLRLP
jgi:hypothetical protein